MTLIASITAVFVGLRPGSAFACSPLCIRTDPCALKSSSSPSSIVTVVFPLAPTVTTNSVPRIAPFAAGVLIENTGIVKAPLNDIDRLNHRRLCRLAAGLGICLFAIVYQDRSLRVEKFQFAVKHRDRRLPTRSDGYHKFGSSYRAVRCRSLDREHRDSKGTIE